MEDMGFENAPELLISYENGHDYVCFAYGDEIDPETKKVTQFLRPIRTKLREASEETKRKKLQTRARDGGLRSELLQQLEEPGHVPGGRQAGDLHLVGDRRSPAPRRHPTLTRIRLDYED